MRITHVGGITALIELGSGDLITRDLIALRVVLAGDRGH